MPYIIRKLPNKDLYRVYNRITKQVHSKAATLENAKRQIKLLMDVENPIKKQPFKKKYPRIL